MKLYSIVEEIETAPNDESSANYKSFYTHRNKSLSAIVHSVEPRLFYLLGDPTDPVTGLASIFQKKSWANKLRLWRKLYSMKLQQGNSLQAHLKQFVGLFEELAAVGDPITEEDGVI